MTYKQRRNSIRSEQYQKRTEAVAKKMAEVTKWLDRLIRRKTCKNDASTNESQS